MSVADPNPYTCRLLIRADWLIYRLRGVRAIWWRDGSLCVRMPAGHGVELQTHFPGWMFHAACYLQNRWPWTRKVLSA